MKIKNIVAAVVATVTVMVGCAVCALAADATYNGFSYKYLDNGTIEISGYSGSATAVKIPAEIEGVEVTSIGKTAFSRKTSITSVTIPSSVDVICDSAFYGCTGLTEITIPEGVTTIEKDAFRSCSNLNKIDMADSVVKLGTGVFESTLFTTFNNEDLLPQLQSPMRIAGKWVIKCYEYADHEHYENVIIPEGTYGIADKAFYGCVNLTSISIPSSVKFIGKEAFYGSELLDSVSFSSNVEQIGKDAFAATPLYARQISDVKYLNGWAIGLADGITSVSFESNTIGICDEMFSGNTAITSITLPANLKYLGEKAFYQCKGISEITIPDTVQRIGSYCFYYAQGLTKVRLPSKLTEIEDYAFSACVKLENINFPTGITRIGKQAFNGARFTALTLPANLKEIGDQAFNGCKSLTTVNFGNKVQSMGYRAFGNCTKLTSINLPNSLKTVGKEAFYGCEKLLNITIPASVKIIGDYAFGYGALDVETWTTTFYDGLQLTCYKNTAGHEYATKHNLNATVLEPVLEAPEIISAVAGNKQVELNWTECAGAEYYQIIRYKNGQYTLVANISGTSATVMGLTNNYKYAFLIASVGADGSKKLSTAVWATPTLKLDKTVVTAQAGDKCAQLSWTAVENAKYYQIIRYKNGQYTLVANISGTSATVMGLTNNYNYAFLVCAVAEDGSKQLSDAVWVKPTKKMGTPVLTATAGDKQVVLNWTAVNDIVRYQVIRYKAGEYTLIANIDPQTTTATVYGLTNGYEYTYLIAAVADDGSKTFSNAEWITPNV